MNRLGPRERLIGAYLALWAALYVAYFWLPEPGSAISYLGLSALPIAAIALGLRFNKPRIRAPWELLAAGQLCFLLGDAIWYTAYLPDEIDPGQPHISDAFYLLGYPLLAVAVALFIRARQPRYRLTAAIDALLIGLAAVLALWLVAIDGFIHDEAVGFSERLVLLAYPIMDVLVLSAAAYLLLSGRQAKGAFWLLAASLAALCAGDVVYPFLPEGTATDFLSDSLWMVSYGLFGLTALVPSMRNLTEESDAPTAPEGGARLVLIGAALTALPAFALIQRFMLDHQDLAVTGLTGAIALVAILVRMRELGLVHRRLESRYSSLLANASDAFAIIHPEGKLAYASPASVRVLGYNPDSLIGRSALEFVHPSGAPDAVAVLRRVAREAGNQEETELRIQRADGEWRWVSIIATNRTDDPEVGGIVLNFRDVTERRENEGRLDMQARVLDEVQHAVLVTDATGKVTYWNGAAEALLGWTAAEIIGKPLAEVGMMADAQRAAEFVSSLSHGGRVSGEYELRRRDGTPVTALLTNSAMLDQEGQPRGMIAVAVDISDRKQLERRLQVQAFTDALTGLANRSLFMDRVQHVLARSRRALAPHELAVLFMDLDDFKTVNDSMGHGAGDQLLTVIGHRLVASLRPSDTAARLGGDEFAVLLEDTSVGEAERVAQRLLAELGAPVSVGEREVRVSASIGIALPNPDGTSTAESLLRDADLAMYRAKARLQGSYAVYQPGMHEAALRRLELKADLQRAIDTDALTLEYQPIFRLADGDAVGAEALLRWPHPDRGQVPVAETLALAEATGLMMPLGAWVLDQACRSARRWRDQLGEAGAETFVSVNASARELLDPSYSDLVASTLARTKLPAHALAIEMTESDLMQESEAAIAALQRLKKLGVRLAIDDFGTGYSSLAYLARFPLDVLKIDRTFVSAGASAQDGAIARAIIDLASSLDLGVIAEGIETEEDRALMASLGADLGQGYFLARPTTSDGALATLRRAHVAGGTRVRRRAGRRTPRPATT